MGHILSRTTSYAILALSVIFTACSSPVAPSPTSAPQSTAPQPTAPTAVPAVPVAATPAAGGEVIRIAAIAPVSGPYAAAGGNAYVRGTEMAAEDINAKGGVTVAGQKRMLKVTIYDDKYTAEGGAAAVQKAIYEDKTNLIVGPLGSAPALAAQPISEKEKALLFVASLTDKDTTPQNPYTFQGILSGRETTLDFYKILREKFPQTKTMAVLNPNDESGLATRIDWLKRRKASGSKSCRRNSFSAARATTTLRSPSC